MEVILSVTPVRAKVWFELSDGEKYWLSRQAALEPGWQAGDEVEPEAFRKLILLRQYPHALNLAVAMLARRPCSRGEIERKLRAARYMDETVEMALYKLEREKLLDDRDFAMRWAQSRAGRARGERLIRQELRQKGVSAEDTESAMAGLDPEELFRQAVSLAGKGLARAGSGEDPRKTASRVTASLIRRGYSWDTARKALEEARRQNG